MYYDNLGKKLNYNQLNFKKLELEMILGKETCLGIRTKRKYGHAWKTQIYYISGNKKIYSLLDN